MKFGLENVDSSMNASVVLLNCLFGFFSFDMKIDDFMILKERMCHLIVHIDFKLSVKKEIIISTLQQKLDSAIKFDRCRCLLFFLVTFYWK